MGNEHLISGEEYGTKEPRNLHALEKTMFKQNIPGMTLSPYHIKHDSELIRVKESKRHTGWKIVTLNHIVVDLTPGK